MGFQQKIVDSRNVQGANQSTQRRAKNTYGATRRGWTTSHKEGGEQGMNMSGSPAMAEVMKKETGQSNRGGGARRARPEKEWAAE
jgi:hypothetical protein